MTMQKIDITDVFQSILISDNLAFWTSKLTNVKFALGANPEISGDYASLLAGFKNKIFIESGSTLWIKVDSGLGSILLDNEIIS